MPQEDGDVHATEEIDSNHVVDELSTKTQE
jgi:hypothetical protein